MNCFKRHLFLITFSTFFALSMFSCSKEKSKFLTAPEFGVSTDLAKHRKANINEITYELKVIVPKELDKPLYGWNRVSFNLKSNNVPIVLDFKVDPKALKSVSMDSVDLDYQFINGHIVLDGVDFQEGQNTVLLEFDLGDQSLNRQEDFLYTLLVPDRASTAFPCFDQPNMKARYKLELDIPKEWEALANGKLIGEDGRGNRKSLSYAETELLPTYLFDFVVGDFERIEKTIGGRKMSMLHRESDTLIVKRNVDEIFDLHLKSIEWLEDYTGISMPFQKFDFALIPSFQYGGMEHPGAISYKASSLFLNENPTQNQELGRASLIAHETAHMWFGNLVTMDWFDDVWMKEVFANFMAAKMVNPSFPEINHDLRFTLSHYPRAYSVDRSQGSHPVQQKLNNLNNAGSLYGAIIYQKAPIAMRMLEKEIGSLAMRKGLSKYLETYSYDNATWDDLIAILDQDTQSDLSAWNKQWIKQSGMPHIKIEVQENTDSSVLFDIKSVMSNGKEWGQNLNFAFLGDDFVAYKDFGFIKDTLGLVYNTKQEVEAMLANGDGYGYGFFELELEANQYLLETVNSFEDALLRGVIWINLWEHMLHSKLQPTALLEPIIESIEKETDPLIRQRLLGYLSTLFWKFLNTSEKAKYGRMIEDFLWNFVIEESDRQVKRAVFSTYRNIASSDQAKAKLLTIWNEEESLEGISLSEQDQINILYQLAVLKVDKIEALIDLQLSRTKNSDRRAKIEFLRPVLSDNLVTRDEFFESLKNEKNRNVETWVQESLGILHHPLRAKESRKYILPTLELMEELQATGDIFFPKRVLDNTFRGHNSREVSQTVEDFLKQRPDYPMKLKNKILQSADLTLRASRILQE